MTVMRDEASNWIIATGQAWKLYVAVVGFGGALALLTAALFSFAMRGGLFMALAACGVFLGASTFVWLVAALRCPRCSARLVWTMAASRPHSSWIIDLAALEYCPQCKDPLARGRAR
jgi:hypothetical protein